MGTQMMEQLQTDYRYDEAKMLAGIQNWQRKRKQLARAAGEEAISRMIPAPKPVHSGMAGQCDDARHAGRSAVVDFASLPSDARAVCAAVCEEFGITLEKLTSPRSTWDICKVRHVAFYLMMRAMGASTGRTATLLGGFHHTTALNGARVVAARMRSDDAYCDCIMRMVKRLSVTA